MNKLTIIGNLTRDPELRSVGQEQIPVCDFTVAVNRRQRNGEQQEADFFRVTAWRGLGETCSKYLAKGRKVCVIGPVSINTYTGQDGQTRASLEVTAEDVEFLSPRDGAQSGQKAPEKPQEAAPAVPPGYVEADEDLPF